MSATCARRLPARVLAGNERDGCDIANLCTSVWSGCGRARLFAANVRMQRQPFRLDSVSSQPLLSCRNQPATAVVTIARLLARASVFKCVRNSRSL